jgi:integrase
MTHKDIEAHQSEKPLWDEKVTGLHVRAFGGKQVFYLYYRTKNGTQRRPKIGTYPTLTLEQAREKAREMLAKVQLGGDPSLEIQGFRGEMTVASLWERVWEGHWNREPYIFSGHAKEVRRLYLANIKNAFATKKLSELTAAIVRNWHASFESVYTANRSLEVLSRMYRFAEEQEWRPQNTNPCKLVKARKEEKRDRYATNEEVLKVGQILEREAEAHPLEVAFIYCLIFSGSRPSAIERARRTDLERVYSDGPTVGILTVAGKTGVERVYLPAQAVQLLDRTVSTDGSLAGRFPRKFWNEVRREAGCPDLWARDWRRTFATVGMSEGHEMSVISELLNHKSQQTTKVYAKLRDDARKRVAEQTASKLEKLLKGEASDVT